MGTGRRAGCGPTWGEDQIRPEPEGDVRRVLYMAGGGRVLDKEAASTQALSHGGWNG